MDIHTPGGFIKKVHYISRTGVYKRTKPINFTYLNWYATQDIGCSIHMCTVSEQNYAVICHLAVLVIILISYFWCLCFVFLQIQTVF